MFTKVKEVSEVFPQWSNLPIHCSSIRVGHSPSRVYKDGQGDKVNGPDLGYPDPPVPRQMVNESPVPGNLATTYPDPLGPVPRVRVGGQYEEVRVGPTTGLQFCRLPFRTIDRPSPAIR